MTTGSKPAIHTLSRPTFDVNEILSFLGQEGLEWRRDKAATAAEELIEAAGRICYMSFGDRQSERSNSDYNTNLIRQGHESVLEHVNWTFLLHGVSRAFTHQLVRHRIGFSYSQSSQQYIDHSEARSIVPATIARDPELAEIWKDAIETSQDAYQSILKRLDLQADTLGKKEAQRAVRSAARSVLPEATEAKIVVTANARALRHFLQVRGSLAGDEEMRIVSGLILREVVQDAPSLFADFREEQMSDGSPIVIHESSTDT